MNAVYALESRTCLFSFGHCCLFGHLRTRRKADGGLSSPGATSAVKHHCCKSCRLVSPLLHRHHVIASESESAVHGDRDAAQGKSIYFQCMIMARNFSSILLIVITESFEPVIVRCNLQFSLSLFIVHSPFVLVCIISQAVASHSFLA